MMKEYLVIKNFFWNDFYHEGESVWLYDKDAEMLIYLGYIQLPKFNIINT